MENNGFLFNTNNEAGKKESFKNGKKINNKTYCSKKLSEEEENQLSEMVKKANKILGRS